MDSKPAQNIQDSFLNTARKERLNITIYLLSGVKLTGRIRSFDKYSVVLETNNQEQLIFKHAISTIAMGRAIHGHTDKPTVMPSSSSTAPAVDAGSAAAAASGTEG
jgi:host factor-I protein